MILNSVLVLFFIWELNWDLFIVLLLFDYKGSIGVSMDLLIRRGGEKGKYGDRKEIYKRDIEWGRGSLLFNY